VGSGNIVHNLKTIRWQKDAATYPWAENFDEWVKEKITTRDHLALAREYLQEESGKWSVPSDDHFFPLLNLLGATSDADKISFPFEGMELGSISLRTIRWG
jgi:4,5-DOPA dioxygenase extradiol